MREFGVLIVWAGAAAAGGAIAAVGGACLPLGIAVVVVSLAGLCIQLLRMMVANAAGFMAASKQQRPPGCEGEFKSAPRRDQGGDTEH